MKLRYQDNQGSKETILFNPETIFYRDGTLIILPSTAVQGGHEYEIPMYAGEPTEVWLDIPQGIYGRGSTKDSSPGTFRAVWIENNTVIVARYKEKIEKSLVDKVFEAVWR